MAWGRLFHWGPLFTIGVIKSIVWSTLHCNSLSSFGFVNSAIFFALACSTLYNFLYALQVGPGWVPLNWRPVTEGETEFLQYCTVCQGFKAPRSHHCRKCNRCILKRDHHCLFINNCVGHLNHTHFLGFLASAIVGCAHASIIIASTLYRALHPGYYYYGQANGSLDVQFVTIGLWPFIICLFSLGLSLGVVTSVGFLFFVQMKAVLKNQTGIEDWVLEKAAYRREGTKETFCHPYNIGIWKNFTQVVNWNFQPKGNGILWDVRQTCSHPEHTFHDYSFTIEQIEQKKLKRERSVDYIIEKEYNGKWFPLTLDCRECIQPACTDEKRLSLEMRDVVTVTRWKRHWMYGEVIERNRVRLDTSERRNLRGWFPRACCSEFVRDSKTQEKCD